MSETSSLSASIAGRYATALFELAQESGALETAEADIARLAEALEASEDLRSLIASPIYSRDAQSRAMAAVGKALDLSELTGNLIGLMAAKRRLFVLPQLISTFRALMAEYRGEITAEVTAARALSDAQLASLSETLKGATGREVKLNVKVDEDLIGGLIVKVGSRMIDTSIRSRLASLQNVMKEVG
ncbi:F0F1 ATP synthase subunit delta [Limibaculum sp. M0105]|uniref:ATP synthase subunit delta n=1 Tax=Thermohalobaculum xanthum TaxID=2753746 RepID=A0A8J7MAA8_9RHOB|nr:F0F1 ATP synthase subunit delta [Thermohalobaculum xanthum]MBK0400680.1 F0F1 ATP synthase subunit delta [Thermohalobaculum xanthum]